MEIFAIVFFFFFCLLLFFFFFLLLLLFFFFFFFFVFFVHQNPSVKEFTLKLPLGNFKVNSFTEGFWCTEGRLNSKYRIADHGCIYVPLEIKT